MKRSRSIKTKVDARTHAFAMLRELGKDKALEIAQKNSVASFNTKEGQLANSTSLFWLNVVGVLQKQQLWK